MYCNATGFAWLIGLSNAVDALSSQAVGARNLPRVGHVTQRGITVMAVAIVPVALLWWFSGFIMGHLGQEPETVVLAEAFARMLLPGLPAAMAFELLKKHLQSCGAVLPPMAAAALALPLNAALSYALVYHSGLSFLGEWGGGGEGGGPRTPHPPLTPPPPFRRRPPLDRLLAVVHGPRPRRVRLLPPPHPRRPALRARGCLRLLRRQWLLRQGRRQRRRRGVSAAAAGVLGGDQRWGGRGSLA